MLGGGTVLLAGLALTVLMAVLLARACRASMKAPSLTLNCDGDARLERNIDGGYQPSPTMETA